MWSIWTGTRSTEPTSSSVTVTVAARESEFHQQSLAYSMLPGWRLSVGVCVCVQVVPEDAAVFSVSAVVP